MKKKQSIDDAILADYDVDRHIYADMYLGMFEEYEYCLSGLPDLLWSLPKLNRGADVKELIQKVNNFKSTLENVYIEYDSFQSYLADQAATHLLEPPPKTLHSVD